MGLDPWMMLIYLWMGTLLLLARRLHASPVRDWTMLVLAFCISYIMLGQIMDNIERFHIGR